MIRLKQPIELQQLFTATGVDLEFSAQEPAHPASTMLHAVQIILENSVATLHPRFFNQNFAGADPIAIIGDWLGAALNTTNATYEAAPIFTLMERALLKKLASVAGIQGAEGLFCAGGSLSNLFAMHLARHRAFPEANAEGIPSQKRLVAFTSAHAHYSLKKAVALLGLGYQNLRVIPCNDKGQMLPDALDTALTKSLEQGESPFFVNATAGTTVVAGFDPIDDIARVLKQHSTETPIWLHVDGCYGGSALFSSAHRVLLKGVEQADSLAWNLHKMMGITQQCSTLLVKHSGLLRSCFATGAGYLFQPDKENADLDSGDRHFQCARRVDVLKLWLTWKYRGDKVFSERISEAVKHAVAFEESLKRFPDQRFVMAHPRNFTNVCFWWLPPALRGKAIEQLTQKEWTLLHSIAPTIKRRMQEEGTAMLGFQAIDERPNFFRILFMNPDVEAHDRQAIIDLIDRYGNEHFG